MRLSLFIIASIVTAAHAATVQFNVISPNATTVQVSVNGQSTLLNCPDKNIPFFTGSVDVGSATSYQYITNNQPESFTRTLSSGLTNTYNEFFGRPITYANLRELPRPLDNGKQWTRADKNPDLFDTNYIPTIFVQGDPTEMQTLIKKVPKTKYFVKLTMIGKDYVRTFSNVTFGITGAGKGHNPAKQQWRWTLSPGDFIDNRNTFKLRNQEEDPTQMREKLYADCLRAMGTYANQANTARFFINNQGMGAFDMLDDITYYSYIRANFYGGNPPEKMGPLYNGGTGASFEYSSTGDYSSFMPVPGSPESSSAIAEVAKPFSQLNLQDTAAIDQFSQIFDVDQYLRFMVMEYLTGSWDGYWDMQTNDGAYKDYANNNIWYYLGQDYDNTFGINMPVNVLSWSYKQYPTKYKTATMINGLLKNADYTRLFESYITDTVKQLFNNNTLGAHVTAYQKFLAPDIKWDTSIKQQSPGFNYGWTYKQSYDSLFKGVDAAAGGSGVQYGLTEWIAKKSEVVAREFGFTL
jgi:spore coat protein CotH